VSLALAGVSLLVTLKRPEPKSTPELMREVNALRLGHADLVDRVEQWQKRDRVRRLREGKEELQQELAPMDPRSVKDQLRRQFGVVP
jgi:hypothetical protein